MKTSDAPIIIEQTFDSSSESVWKAITEIGQMRQWYFENLPAFKPEIGFETQFSVHSEERTFLHKWEVTEVHPLKMIKYNWEFEEYPGKSSATFELSKHDNLTKLRLTVDILENFPENIPEFTRESCIAGWGYFIKQNLKDYLNKIEIT